MATDYEVEKAVEWGRDNTFARARLGTPNKKRGMPEILQFEDQEESPPGSASRRHGSAPSSMEPTPAERPFAGMRDQGKLLAGVDKFVPPPRFTRRVSLVEGIQQLGNLFSPVSPASPHSPTTMRSPLRFFRAREDKRDALLAQKKVHREIRPARNLRERVREEGVMKMDLEWERYQRRKPLQELVRGCVKILVFIRRRLFSGWGKWFQEGFVLSEDSLEEYMAAITKSPLNSIPRLRALESMFHLSYSSSNQLVMAQGDVLAFMMGEVKKAEDGSKQQAMALAIIRNLCMLSGYRPSAAKEVTEMLVAVCWAVNDDACKQHALGALANLSANERPGELILAQNGLDVVLHLCPYGSPFAKLLTDPERHVRSLALMVLFNLSVVPKNRSYIVKSKALETLLPLLQEPDLVGLLATITSMQLITHKNHPMLIFTERQRNVPELVRCLKHALEGTKLYGLKWNPRHVLHAITTLMLFEPNHRLVVQAGIDELLVKVVFGQNESVRSKYWMDIARDLRSKIAPLVVKHKNMNPDEESAEEVTYSEAARRAALLGRRYSRPSTASKGILGSMS